MNCSSSRESRPTSLTTLALSGRFLRSGSLRRSARTSLSAMTVGILYLLSSWAESDKGGLLDLLVRRPGHGVDDFDGLRDHEWLKPLAACRAKNGGRYLAAVIHYYEGVDGLTENLVRPPNHSGLEHTGRGSQRGLDLGGSDLLPARLDHVVHPRDEIEVPVIIEPTQ